MIRAWLYQHKTETEKQAVSQTRWRSDGKWPRNWSETPLIIVDSVTLAALSHAMDILAKHGDAVLSPGAMALLQNLEAKAKEGTR